jgi:hypothetical protein
VPLSCEEEAEWMVFYKIRAERSKDGRGKE